MATEVWTADDLSSVRNDMAGDYVQMADIDLAGVSWWPLGASYPSEGPAWYIGNTPFTGNYNGNHYVIKNMNVSGTGHLYCGLFAGIGAGGKVEKTHLEDSTVYEPNGSPDIVNNTGLLVGYNRGTIELCSVKGNVTGTQYVGGLTGWQFDTGVMRNCFSAGNVANSLSGGTPSYIYVGGLIGAAGSTIENTYSYANVTMNYGGALDHFVGGLVGYNEIAPVASYYDTEVSGQSDTGKGEPRSTAEMTYPENFTTTFISWDFDTIWRHDPDYTINNGYPPLRGSFRIWVKKSPNPSFLPPLWLDWKTVPVLWVYKEFEWKSVTGVWVKKGDEWKTV